MFVRTAEVEDEVYRIVDLIPNIELLILSGHGTASALSLGGTNLLNVKDENDEKYFIDSTDTELGSYLQKLNPYAVIFLNSCDNANEDNGSNNLANFISQISGDRKVIASKLEFSQSDIKVLSVYPFEIRIFWDLGSNDDITYTNKL